VARQLNRRLSRQVIGGLWAWRTLRVD